MRGFLEVLPLQEGKVDELLFTCRCPLRVELGEAEEDGATEAFSCEVFEAAYSHSESLELHQK